MKHTPGPWKIKKDLGGYLDLFGEDGDKILISKFRLINQEANAALIAAVPELLEALELFLPMTKPGAWIEREALEFIHTTCKVLIAKAKGE